MLPEGSREARWGSRSSVAGVQATTSAPKGKGQCSCQASRGGMVTESPWLQPLLWERGPEGSLRFLLWQQQGHSLSVAAPPAPDSRPSPSAAPGHWALSVQSHGQRRPPRISPTLLQKENRVLSVMVSLLLVSVLFMYLLCPFLLPHIVTPGLSNSDVVPGFGNLPFTSSIWKSPG